MTNFLIEYSIGNEIDRVLYTLKKREWYESNGYKVTLPKNTDSQNNLEEVIRSEFSEDGYKSYAEGLVNQLQDYLVSNKSVSDFPLLLNNQYIIVLTRYGTAGSYNTSDNKIIINIELRKKEGALGTIIHEMVHLAIESYIKKYNVKHWYKERIVDLICNKYFSDIRKPQSIQENVSKVDDSFVKYFPDIDAVTRSIGE